MDMQAQISLKHTSTSEIIRFSSLLNCCQNNNHIRTFLGFKHVGMRSGPTISSQKFCVRRSTFYQTFCLSFFHPDPYLRALSQAHTSFCTKQELSISQLSCFFFSLSLFPRWSKCTDHQTLIPPRPPASFKSRDMVNQMKLCSKLQVVVVLCLAHLHLCDMEPR